MEIKQNHPSEVARSQIRKQEKPWEKILEARKRWSIGNRRVLLFSLCCGHKFHKQCISYRAVMREMMKNLGQKNGHVSHHEHPSGTCRAASLFWHNSEDTHRKGLPEHPTDHSFWVFGIEHWIFSHPIYIWKAKTSSRPFLYCSNCVQKHFKWKNVTDLVIKHQR